MILKQEIVFDKEYGAKTAQSDREWKVIGHQNGVHSPGKSDWKAPKKDIITTHANIPFGKYQTEVGQ